MLDRLTSTTYSISRLVWRIAVSTLMGLLACVPSSAQTPAVPSMPPNVTSYEQMRSQLKAASKADPMLKVCSLGKSASGKRDVLLVRYGAADSTRSVRVLVLCRQHGDEPASTESMLGLLRRLSVGADPEMCGQLKTVSLYIVPMVNPDGADANTRDNYAGADLNRDWGVFRQPETRAVARLVKAVRPHIILDAHNWDGYDPYDANCVEVTLSPRTGWPLAHATADQEGEFVSAVRSLQSESVASLDGIGYSVHPTAYAQGNDPHLAHRYFMSRGILAMLVETHAGPSADSADFERRQGLYSALVHFLVRTACEPGAYGLGRLNALEGYQSYRDASSEVALFSPPEPKAKPAAVAASPRSPHAGWIWPACLMTLVLIGAGALSMGNGAPRPSIQGADVSHPVFRMRSDAHEAIDSRCYSQTELTLTSAQASGWQSAYHRGRRRYRY